MRPLVMSTLTLALLVSGRAISGLASVDNSTTGSRDVTLEEAEGSPQDKQKAELLKNLTKYASPNFGESLREIVRQLYASAGANASANFDQQTLNQREQLIERGARNGMSLVLEAAVPGRPAAWLLVLANKTSLLAGLSSTGTDNFYYWKFGQTAATIVIFVMIVFGNLSILHRLKSCRRRRSNVNYFIVQLAIADLFVGFFNVTLDFILRLQREFTYGPLACRASKYISVLFIYSSTYLLVALSIDRWEAVVKPLAFTRNRSRGYYLVVGAWVLAFVCATPVTLHTRIKEFQGRPQCWIQLDELGWKLYMVWLTCSLLIIPALIIAVCYTHIVYTIWTKGRLGGGSGSGRPEPGRLRVLLRRLRNRKREEEEAGGGVARAIEEAAVVGRAGGETGRKSSADARRAQLESCDDSELESISTDEEPANEGHPAAGCPEQGSRETGNGYEEAAAIRLGSEAAEEFASKNQRQIELNTLPAARQERFRCRGSAPQQHGTGVIPQARIKTIKMTLVIVAAFLLCWAPFYIINLCSVFGLFTRENNFTLALRTLTQSLAHLNSAMNPIIFWLFSSKRLRPATQRSATVRSVPTSDTNNQRQRPNESELEYNLRAKRKEEPAERKRLGGLPPLVCFCFRKRPIPCGKKRLATDSRLFDSTSGGGPKS